MTHFCDVYLNVFMRFLNDRVKWFWFIGFMWIINYSLLIDGEKKPATQNKTTQLNNQVVRTQEFVIHIKVGEILWSTISCMMCAVVASQNVLKIHSFIFFSLSSKSSLRIFVCRKIKRLIRMPDREKKLCPPTTKLIMGKRCRTRRIFIFFSTSFNSYRHIECV